MEGVTVERVLKEYAQIARAATPNQARSRETQGKVERVVSGLSGMRTHNAVPVFFGAARTAAPLFFNTSIVRSAIHLSISSLPKR